MNLFRQGLSEHIKAYSVFTAIFMNWEMTRFILKNTDYRSSHLKG